MDKGDFFVITTFIYILKQTIRNKGPVAELRFWCTSFYFILTRTHKLCQRKNLIHEQLLESSKCMDSQVKKTQIDLFEISV